MANKRNLKGKDNKFSEKDEDVLAAVSSHVAAYIQDVDSKGNFKDVIKACSSNMYVKSSRILLSEEQRLNQLFTDVMKYVKTTMRAEAAMLLLLDDTTDPKCPVLYSKHSEGIKCNKKGTPLDVGIVASVAKTGKAVVLNDVTQNQELYGPSQRTGFFGADVHVRSVICVPIFDTRGKVIGILKVLNKLPASGEIAHMRFTEHDKDILNNIATHVALNLEGTGSSLKKVLKMVKEQNNAFTKELKSHIKDN